MNTRLQSLKDCGWSADYIRHRPAQLDKGIRWISRTADQDALGVVLAATAEPEGYLAEKAKGNIKDLPAKGEFRWEMEMGALTPADAQPMEEKGLELFWSLENAGQLRRQR